MLSARQGYEVQLEKKIGVKFELVVEIVPLDELKSEPGADLVCYMLHYLSEQRPMQGQGSVEHVEGYHTRLYTHEPVRTLD
jgi:hypothetical protein